MAGTTPNLGLYLPGGGSTGTWTPDEVADVDPLNQNFQKIDTFAGQVGVQTSRNQQFYGPAAAISSVSGMKLGDEYQESDAGKILWRYDGSNWTRNVGGLLLLRPGSVQGHALVTISPTGSVDIGAIPNGVRVDMDNIFDPTKYKRYKVFHTCTKTAITSAMTGLFRTGVPADINAATYFNYAWFSVNGGAVTVSHGPTQANFGQYLDPIGNNVTADLTLTFSPDNMVATMYGTLTTRSGTVELRTASVAFEGLATSTIRGLGISYAQAMTAAKWTFYAYVD